MTSYTVAEFTKSFKYLVENTYSDVVAITGEVSNLTKASSGHYYFTLKDVGSQLSAVMFKQYAMAMRSLTLKNGDKIQAIGNISVYEAGGSYQLMVKRVQYDSLGDYWQQFELTKRKLEAEGLFDSSRKKFFQRYPNRVALITSTTGAAIKDFLVTAKNEGGKFDIDIWNVPVQGVEAAPKIVKALKAAGEMVDRYDAIILTRGGGSLEDLSVFNNEEVARAFANSKVPTISAIGHERDVSIVDFVADCKAATPTASAVLMSSGFNRAGDIIKSHYDKLINTVIYSVQSQYQYVDMLELKVKNMSPVNNLANYKLRLNNAHNNLNFYSNNFAKGKYNNINSLTRVLMANKPTHMINTLNVKLDIISKKLLQYIDESISNNIKYVDVLESKLKLVNPENILERGYAIVSKGKSVVTKANDVKKKEVIEIKMKDGYISSSVIDVHLEAE